MSLDIVCFANDWDGDPLSKKHIMQRLARRGARVLWVNSLGNRAPQLANAKDWRRAVRKLHRFVSSAIAGPRPVEPRLWVLDPIAIPSYGNRVAAAANALAIGLHVRAAVARLGMHRPVHYTFVPASAWVAGRLGESLLVYHAADEYAAFGGTDVQAVSALEEKLLDRADLYVACSAPLLQAKSARTRRSILVRHGVEHAHFARALEPDLAVPAALATLPRPLVGFFGLIAEWVDLRLCARVADELARTGGGTVVIVGDERGAKQADLAALRAHPNVVLTGRVPYAELPAYARAFAVGLLPFDVTPLTVAANPLKLREYLAAGLPVVSTDLPESRALAALVEPNAPGAVHVATTADDFVRAACEGARAADAGPQLKRSRAVAREGWDDKAAEIETLLTSALSDLPLP